VTSIILMLFNFFTAIKTNIMIVFNHLFSLTIFYQ
jgi:hypothetical protein